MRFCKRPFENIEIDDNFFVYTCCPWYTNHYNIGNVSTDSFDEIWNSKNAQNFRQKILNGDYSLCNTAKCCEYNNLADIPKEEIEKKYSTVMKDYPVFISLDYDRTCNAKCIICRDKCISNKQEETKKLNDIAEKTILPLLKSAKTVYLSGAGEVFYSTHSKHLIKRITELYPEIKFDIISNGLLCNKENIEKTGLKGKITKLTLSIHAATKETYKKIVRAGSFDTILKNLAYLQELKASGEIGLIQLIFIVSSLNYKDMPLFAEMAKKFGMVAVFCEYVKRDDTEMGKNAENYMIHLPSHPLHKDFLNILQDERLNYAPDCFFNPLIANLKNQATEN